MPSVGNKKEFKQILIETHLDTKCNPSLKDIVNSYPINSSTSNGVGISDLLTVLELAKNDQNQISKDSFLTAWRSKFTSHSSCDNEC